MRARPPQGWPRTAKRRSPPTVAGKYDRCSQWELESANVQALLAFLEERRALYAPGARLQQGDVRISVQKIADECAWCLKQLEGQSPGAMLIQEIASACRYFVDQSKFASNAEFYMTVGALRLIIAAAIVKLSMAYNVSGALPIVGPLPAFTHVANYPAQDGFEHLSGVDS